MWSIVLGLGGVSKNLLDSWSLNLHDARTVRDSIEWLVAPQQQEPPLLPAQYIVCRIGQCWTWILV